MLIKRRTLLAAAGASTLAAPAIAQAKQIQLAGASYDMREAILGEFAKRTGITPRPFVNPSTQVRIDRLRTAPVCSTVSSTSQPRCTVWPGTMRAAWAPNWSYFSTSPSQRSKMWRRTAPKYSTAVQRADSRLACRCDGASVICSARTEKDTGSPNIGTRSGGRGT